MNMLRDVWTTVTSDPVTLVASLMMAAALLALLLIATPTRGKAKRPNAPKRPAQARSLAASGTQHAEIARRTGLSRDAVALVLAATPAADLRKARPVAAPFTGKTTPSRVSPTPERSA
ncbi:MAG: hypothetical protein ABI877_15320 [Gemmatimonadaceae bacterium]